MFIKAKHRLNKNEYCYVNTDYITEIFPPTDNKCGTVYLVNKNYSLDIDKEEFEKIIKNDFKAESEKKEEISKDDAIKIVHDTIYDFFVDSETFNDKDELLLKINKAICNNIMGY